MSITFPILLITPIRENSDNSWSLHLVTTSGDSSSLHRGTWRFPSFGTISTTTTMVKAIHGVRISAESSGRWISVDSRRSPPPVLVGIPRGTLRSFILVVVYYSVRLSLLCPFDFVWHRPAVRQEEGTIRRVINTLLMVDIAVMVLAFPYNFSTSVELNGLFTLALGVASRSFAAWTLTQHMCAQNSNSVRIASIVGGSLSFLANSLYLALSATGSVRDSRHTRGIKIL